MALRLAFHGGAGTVTGSRFLLSSGQHDILVDCGLFQGLKELRLRNWDRPSFDPRRVDAVLLTHAHVDHSGYLPRFVREGFRGPIHCTEATAELARIVLMDAARLQEEDADYANRKSFSKHHPALPLFTEADAQACFRYLRPVPYERPIDLPGHFRATFHNAGHILGSAHIEVEARADGQARLAFSGDLGRRGMPLHVDPQPLPAVDTLVLESTYGDRVHDPEPIAEQLRRPFEAAIRRKGTILIPAFAVARAQLVTLILDELMESGRLPRIPIHLDSPMAADVTDVYSRHLRGTELDPGTGHGRHLLPPDVQIHRTGEESRRLNNLTGPRVIIASSGMLTGGRVLHHLRRILPDDDALLVLVGFQAAGTRGRKLLEGARTIRMHGEDVPVNCHFIAIDGLSAHADRNELLAWVRGAPRPPRAVFLAHGEPEASAAMAAAFEHEGIPAIVPRLGQAFEYIPGTHRWREARID